jgi:hypothetical protein
LSDAYFIIYADILGFEKLAETLFTITNYRSVEEAREHFLLRPFKEKCEEIAVKYDIESRPLTDDCYFFARDLNQVTHIVSSIISIGITVQNFKYIPVSVAIGRVDLRESSSEVFVKDEVIKALKNDLIGKFKKNYQYITGESIRESFIVCSDEFYQHLDNLEKEHYQAIKLSNNEIIYVVNPSKYRKHAMLLEFIHQVELPVRYQRIDDVYVKPVEFETLLIKIKENHILFLTGSGELGKTFTAVRIMYELHLDSKLKGFYHPGTVREERLGSSKALVALIDDTPSNSIIYFEDPFGKYRYEQMKSSSDTLRAV